MIARIVLAAVAGVIVTLLCILVGSLLLSINVGIAVVLGGFLKSYAGVLGILSALWYYFAGRLTLIP